MGFLQTYCFFSPYIEQVAASCDSFSCGNSDMDDFFLRDAFEYATFKMGRSFCFRLSASPNIIVCIFTISNDSIRIYDLPRSRKDHMLRITHHHKRLNRYPGILIGRIAVNEQFARMGIGSEVLDFIKEWFSDEQYLPGCRFVIVDAINDAQTLQFYHKNDFVFLFSSEKQEEIYTSLHKGTENTHNDCLRTRIMYYDLLNW